MNKDLKRLRKEINNVNFDPSVLDNIKKQGGLNISVNLCQVTSQKNLAQVRAYCGKLMLHTDTFRSSRLSRRRST